MTCRHGKGNGGKFVVGIVDRVAPDYPDSYRDRGDKNSQLIKETAKAE